MLTFFLLLALTLFSHSRATAQQLGKFFACKMHLSRPHLHRPLLHPSLPYFAFKMFWAVVVRSSKSSNSSKERVKRKKMGNGNSFLTTHNCCLTAVLPLLGRGLLLLPKPSRDYVLDRGAAKATKKKQKSWGELSLLLLGKVPTWAAAAAQKNSIRIFINFESLHPANYSEEQRKRKYWINNVRGESTIFKEIVCICFVCKLQVFFLSYKCVFFSVLIWEDMEIK